MKDHIVHLTDEVRQQLMEAVQWGTWPVRVVRRALILLQSDAGLTDLQIVERLGCAEGTVRKVRKRFCQEGLKGALYESPRSGRPSDFTVRQKQQIVALACTDPPEGRAHWTLELLCEHATRQGVVESISKSAVSLLLKTYELKPWRKEAPVWNEVERRVLSTDGKPTGSLCAAAASGVTVHAAVDGRSMFRPHNMLRGDADG